MSFLDKEFEYEKHEGVDALLAKLGKVPEDLMDFKRKVKFTKKGDNYAIITIRQDGNKETVFKSGVEFDDEVRGRPVKSTFTIEGNSLSMLQKFGEGKFFTVKNTFTDDMMISVASIGGVDGQATIYFKRV